MNQFAETIQRDIASNRISLDKASTEQYTTPEAAYGYPTGQYPAAQYPASQYGSGQHPPAGYPMAGYPPQYGRQGPSVARGVILGLAMACVIALVIGCVVVWKKVSDASGTTTETTTAQIGQPQPGPTTTTTYVDPETQAASDLASATASDTAYMRSNDNRWTAQ